VYSWLHPRNRNPPLLGFHRLTCDIDSRSLHHLVCSQHLISGSPFGLIDAVGNTRFDIINPHTPQSDGMDSYAVDSEITRDVWTFSVLLFSCLRFPFLTVRNCLCFIVFIVVVDRNGR